MKLHRNLIARLILICAAVLMLTASSALGALPDQAEQPDIPALLRVDLRDSADLERLAATGLPVYAHLHSRSGGEYVLLLADAAQRDLLADLGLTARILDQDSRAASYYLLYAPQPDMLLQAGDSVRVLEQDGVTALARLEAQAVENLAQAGVELNRLQLHELVVPVSPVTSLPADIEPDPVIQEMIDRVLAGSVSMLDGGLSGEFPVIIGGSSYTIATRHTGQAIPMEKATQYTYEYFQSQGLPVSYHYYNHPSYGQRRNVVAEQPGYDQADRIFLITAHLDDMPSGTYAPGADDNASGSTGVLIAANILSDYDFDCTLRYVLFTGEEQGLYGSYFYAQDAYNNGENIEGVLNLDMIAYNSDAYPIVDLHSRSYIPGSTEISYLFADVVDAYNIPLTPQILVNDSLGNYSDNASFWDFGFPAILGIEDYDDFTPYYHTTSDQLETLDLAYFTNFVKAAVGTFAHMGCPLGYLAGQVTDAESGDPMPSASITAEDEAGQQHFVYTDSTGLYQLPLTPATYTVGVLVDGYSPFSASDIAVTTGMTTTLDIALQPCHLQGVDFTYSPPDPLSGQAISFAASVGINSTLPVSYTWDFGDGHSGSGQETTHTYTLGGTYPVTLSAENCAAILTATHPVSVESVPGINLSAQSFDIDAAYGQTLTQTLEIGNSGESTLAWSLLEQPDVLWLAESVTSGELDPQQRQEITLTIQAPSAHGIYTTTLQVMSNDPDKPQTDIPVTLQVACASVAGVDFTFSPTVPRIAQNVVFNSQVMASQPITYTWSFQDGSPDQGGQGLASVEHAFPVSSTDQAYPVTLSADNACSEPALAENIVLVSAYKAFLPVIPAQAP